jgi:hypothetical protein
MTPVDDRPLNIVAAFGLALGAAFGLAGTFAPRPHLRSVAWAIDGVGLVVATALLAFKFFRRGRDFVAAGLLVFAVGEGVILSGTAAGSVGSIPSFGAGAGLWAAVLLLTKYSQRIPILGSARWRRDLSSLFHYVGENLLGGAGIANVIASSVLCIPAVCDGGPGGMNHGTPSRRCSAALSDADT